MAQLISSKYFGTPPNISKYLIVSDEEADLMFSKSHGDLPDAVKEARDKGGDHEYKMKNKISIYNEITEKTALEIMLG